MAASFNGHCRHANTHRLHAAMNQQFPWLNAATRRRKFHHQLEGLAIAIPVIAAENNKREAI